jgi:putative transcriptional regulator
MDETTMREFDALCLPPVKIYTPAQIKRLRRRFKASQAVFAAYLNTSPSTVQKWEQGQKKPNGPSLKLLNIVDKKGLEVLG